jgi:hypothetical protein
MNTYYLIYSILSFLAILSIPVGLWIAKKFLPTCINWLRSKVNDDLFSRSIVKIIVWLVLGGLFTLPFLDIIKWLVNWANLIFIPVGQSGMFTTFLGPIPINVYFGFMILLLFVLYGVVFWFASNYLSTPGQLNQAQRIFVVLIIASLFYRGISNILIYIFSLQFPPNFSLPNYGLTGFFSEVVGGIVILILILFGIQKLSPNQTGADV